MRCIAVALSLPRPPPLPDHLVSRWWSQQDGCGQGSVLGGWRWTGAVECDVVQARASLHCLHRAIGRCITFPHSSHSHSSSFFAPFFLPLQPTSFSTTSSPTPVLRFAPPRPSATCPSRRCPSGSVQVQQPPCFAPPSARLPSVAFSCTCKSTVRPLCDRARSVLIAHSHFFPFFSCAFSVRGFFLPFLLLSVLFCCVFKVKSMGGHAVVKVPYSNAGQGR